MNARRSFDHRPVTLRFALGGALVAALTCAGTAQAAGAPQCPAAQMAGAGQMCGKSVVQADPKLEKLAAKAEKAVAKAPADAALRFALGRAYMKVGRFESAVTALADAVSLGDSSPRAQLNLWPVWIRPAIPFRHRIWGWPWRWPEKPGAAWRFWPMLCALAINP